MLSMLLQSRKQVIWLRLPHPNRTLLTDVRPAGHLAHRLLDILEVVDQSLLGLSEVGVIVFT